MTINSARQVKFRSGRTGHFAGFLNYADTFFCTWISPRECHHLIGLNVVFKGLNWFYYILSKASDLQCQQVIFSKSQVRSQVMIMDSKSKSSPKSMREVASQVTSHKNGDSGRTRIQVT